MCEGDFVAGYNSDAVCYRLEGCYGCDKCIIKCTGCDNCPIMPEKTRQPEVGDYVTVISPIIGIDYKGPKWTPAMDMAIGRTAWVASGNTTEGFQLKFITTTKEILDQFHYPPTSLKLAMKNDMAIDKMIKTTKEGSPNEDM